MIRLIVFDLDGTLAPVGRPIAEETLRELRALEDRGIRIALCSGKPLYYLCGVLRQAGLTRPILLGENGATMQVGIDLPPAEHYMLPCSAAARASLRLIREALDEILPDLWYQPNEVGLTPFFRTREENEAIGACVDRLRNRITDVDIYPQSDCYDFTPSGISKAEGLRALGEYLNIPMEEIAAVGDGINDYPMLRTAGFSVGIRLKDPSAARYQAENIGQAMSLLRKAAGDNSQTFTVP